MAPLVIGIVMIGGSLVYGAASYIALQDRAKVLREYVDAYLAAANDDERTSIKHACMDRFRIASGDFDTLIVQVRQQREAAANIANPTIRNPVSFERTS